MAYAYLQLFNVTLDWTLFPAAKLRRASPSGRPSGWDCARLPPRANALSCASVRARGRENALLARPLNRSTNQLRTTEPSIVSAARPRARTRGPPGCSRRACSTYARDAVRGGPGHGQSSCIAGSNPARGAELDLVRGSCPRVRRPLGVWAGWEGSCRGIAPMSPPPPRSPPSDPERPASREHACVKLPHTPHFMKFIFRAGSPRAPLTTARATCPGGKNGPPSPRRAVAAARGLLFKTALGEP